jgi:hypothetical protein
VHVRACPALVAGHGSIALAHACESRVADVQDTPAPVAHVLRAAGCPSEEIAMSHLLVGLDDRWSSAPKVVAASSIRDC